MNTKKIYCWTAELIVPEDLVDIWPHSLPLPWWPTYCGAGEGIGDRLVPDKLRRAYLQPACFIHDIEWALAPSRNPVDFVSSNFHFWLNLRSLVISQIPKSEPRRLKEALHLCNFYVLVVTSPIGWRNFRPEGTTIFNLNQDVKEKVHKLAMACIKYESNTLDESERLVRMKTREPDHNSRGCCSSTQVGVTD